MADDQAPVLIGAGQLTQRDVDPAGAMDPIEMMARVARLAADDAGAGPGLLARVDSVAVVNMIAWQYQSAPRLLAERLGAHPAEELYTTVGGNTPQWLVNRSAEKIAAGRTRLVLLAGAEVAHTVFRAHRSRITLPWSSGGTGTPTVVGDPRPGTTAHEMAHGLQMPVQIYPLFENALRAARRLTLAQHRERLGLLCSRLSAVAAENPEAWFRRSRTPEEIVTVTRENRMVAFPYTKYMSAIFDVDQAAAVLMTSVAGARGLGIHPSRWVYLRAATDANDLWFLSERVNYHTSPAIRLAGERALAAAGTTIEEIDHIDLYSCFPCAVQISRDMLGIAEDDPRPLTVTGGLPYAGGPGSNYTMHAIAVMMGKLRANPGSLGLITALGWYLTKHSVAIYSTSPPLGRWAGEDLRPLQARLDAAHHPPLVEEARGRGVIETYTVLHDREGAPVRGVVIGRLPGGERFLANTPADRAVLEDLMTSEGCGRRGTVLPAAGLNRFEPE